MANAGELSFRDVPDCGLAIVSPNDPGAMLQYAEECRTLGIPFIWDPGQQCARMSGDELRDGMSGGDHRHFQRLRIRTDPAEDGDGRGGDPAAKRRADRHAWRARVQDHRAACDDRRRRPCPISHCRSDGCRRRLSRRPPERVGSWRELSRLRPDRQRRGRPTRWSTSEARVTPIPGRSSSNGTNNTSATQRGFDCSDGLRPSDSPTRWLAAGLVSD